MSDTITQEERARLRGILSEHGDGRVEDRIMQRLLNVKSRNNHIHRLLGEALESERNLDGMKSRWQASEARAERAEAENVRLTKMVDWLAEKQIRCAANGEQWYGPTTSKDMYVPMYASKIEAINALAEAARRAVAAGEG